MSEEPSKISRRDYLKYLGAGIVGVVIGAAGTYATYQPPPPPTPKYERVLKKYGGTLKVCLEGEATELDPHISTLFVCWWVEEQIFEGLVTLDQELNIVPLLAKRYEIPDPRTYKFYLRENVKFHDGKKMTAEDVKYSFERIKDPETGSPTKAFFDPIERIEIPDDYTVILHLSKSSAPLLTKLAEQGPRCAIVSKDNVEAEKIATEPVGTGPFKFSEWARGDHITLPRFDEYWDVGLPYVDTLEFYFQGDPEVMLTMLQTRAVHQASPIYYTYVPDVETEDLTSDIQKITGFHWVALNLKYKPYDDLRVRQAIAHAIDRAEVCDLVFMGYASPIDHPLMAGTPWFVPVSALPHNPDKAKELLADAGYADGFTDTFLAAPTPEERKMAEVIVGQLGRVKIDMSIDMPEVGTYIDEALTKKTFHITNCGWTPPPEPDIILSAFLETDGWLNMPGYSNSEVDELFKKGREEVDPKERKKIYNRILEIVLPDASINFIESLVRIYAWWRDLHGFTARPDLAQYFKTCWFEEPEKA